MTYTYSLLDEPWIPCIDSEGQAVALGLRDTLARAHELREVGGESPLVTAAITRLLLAVLHRLYGPESWDDWDVLWRSGRLDAAQVDGYLLRWRERFDLFHPEHPFYQVTEMPSCFKPKSLTSLVFDAASGNNATLFDHHLDAEGLTLTPAQATRALLAAQAFGLAGLCLRGYTFTDAPWARGIVFLAQGDSLFQTLVLNLIRYDDARPMPRQPNDCPAWEMEDAYNPDRKIPLGYLDYLSWQNRRAHLIPETVDERVVVRRMLLGPGLRLSADVVDPQKHYRKDKKRGLLPLRFNEHRALWRDSAALFRPTSDAYQPPREFDWLRELVSEDYLDVQQTRRMYALGMANNQAKVEFFRAERWPLPLVYLQKPELVDALDQALLMADSVSRQLWGASRTLAMLFICPEANLEGAHQPAPEDVAQVMAQWNMRRRYWSSLEAPFRLTLEALTRDRDAALEVWRTTLRRAAWATFESVAANLDAQPRTLKAAVRGRGQLAAGLAKALPNE